jgi:hypothetical protein
MKKSSLVLVALLLAAPVFADDAKADAAQPLTLASADTSVSTNLKPAESNDLTASLEKEIKEFTESLNAKIDAELSTKATDAKF